MPALRQSVENREGGGVMEKERLRVAFNAQLLNANVLTYEMLFGVEQMQHEGDWRQLEKWARSGELLLVRVTCARRIEDMERMLSLLEGERDGE